MKKFLLSSAAIVFFGAGTSFAAVPALDLDDVLAAKAGMIQLAKDGDGGGDGGGGDGGGGDGGGGDRRGHGGGDDDGDDDDDRDDDADGDDDDGDASGSGRRKPRIPGGSGCDDPGDVAEHPACTPTE